MNKAAAAVSLVLLASAFAFTANAQAPASRAMGAVTAVDADAKKLSIKTDAGADLSVALQDRTNYLRVPPGEKDFKNATKIAAKDIGVGDRVLARGAMSEDQKTLTATTIVVMTKADIAKKHEADKAEWQKRGVSGVITALNADSKQITLSVRSREGVKPLLIPVTGNVDMRRYAPDSVRFADAKPSTFAELKVGDQVRALGNKSEDGLQLTPEFIVSGAFRNIAATIISVDPAAKTLKINDLDTKKPVLVRVEPDSTVRKLPPFVANMLAQRLKGGGAGAPPSGPGGPGGPGGQRGGGDLEQMLERMPPLDLADLKPGDALVIASTAGAEPDRVTAITLLAGVEPILTSAPKGGQGMALGAWNLGMGGAGME